MSEPRPGYGDRIPEEIRGICMGLCRDVAALHLKWDTYLELIGRPDNAALLTDTAPAFFKIVAESLRDDIVQSIRLGVLCPDNPSLATLVARCPDVPHLEELLTAFQAACGPVRRYRHRHLGHNDPSARIRPQADLLPDVGRVEIGEILLLAGGILKAVHGYFLAGDPDFQSAPSGDVGELILRLRVAQGMERQRWLPGDGPV